MLSHHEKAGVKAGEPEDFCHASVVPQTCSLYFLEDLKGRTLYSNVGFFFLFLCFLTIAYLFLF